MPRNRTQCTGSHDESGRERDVHASASDVSELIAAHESLADAFAAQGDWRSAYEHVRAALGHAREVPAGPYIPDQDRREVERLRHESITDALTETYNRRYLDRALPALDSVAVALVDLDNFKDVNDRFGHDVGDRVLRQVARILRQTLPAGAFCVRYGGEEFVLAVPTESAMTAVALVERARERVGEFAWSTVRSGLAVTISAGVALADGDARARLRTADKLLYQAKRAGRNVVAFGSDGEGRLLRTLSGCALAPPW